MVRGKATGRGFTATHVCSGPCKGSRMHFLLTSSLSVLLLILAAGCPGRSPGAVAGAGEGEGEGHGQGQGQGQREGEGQGQGEGEGSGVKPGSGSGAVSGPGGSSTATDLSSAATAAQVALAPRDQIISRAIRQLSRSTASDGSTYDSFSVGIEVELGAQLAEVLLPDPEGRELARTVRALYASPATVVPPDARSLAEKLIVLLEAARHGAQRDEQVRRFNPDELDPAYRDAVEAYFEKLSRDAAKR